MRRSGEHMQIACPRYAGRVEVACTIIMPARLLPIPVRPNVSLLEPAGHCWRCGSRSARITRSSGSARGPACRAATGDPGRTPLRRRAMARNSTPTISVGDAGNRTCVPLSSGSDQTVGSHGDRRSGGTRMAEFREIKLRPLDANSIERGLQSSTRDRRFPVPGSAPAATGHVLSAHLAITGRGHQR